MNGSIDRQQPLRSNHVVIATAQPAARDYLRTVLEFIDCDVTLADDPDQVAEACRDASERAVSVFVDGADNPARRQAVLDAVNLADPKPALFQIQPEGEADSLISGEVLGVLRLPTQFDALAGLLHKAQVFNENQRHGEGARRPLELFRSLSGNSRATRRINKMIEQVAGSDATVLILGESGTGKEVVARKLHFHSQRRGKPFVPVNCGAIPGDLLESELFGHEKGAFTGAITARQGRFEMAEGGTLFLDEIGDMSLHMQVKLLRVLQERTFERVGSNRTMHCDVRIIAATHRHLEEMIKQGKFREDLYYRLNVFPIDMPPLRERVEDIPILVNDLIHRIEHEKRGSVRLTPGAVTALQHYAWPGNVRELANLIERLAILYPYGVVDVGDLPEKFRAGVPVTEQVLAAAELPEVTVPGGEPETVAQMPRLPNTGIDLKAHLAHLELNLIRQALDESNGVVAHAAKRLKMRRTTLVEKLRKYGLQRGQELTG
jgi:sigma-54 specific flagellar transcriptional regulator A